MSPAGRGAVGSPEAATAGGVERLPPPSAPAGRPGTPGADPPGREGTPAAADPRKDEAEKVGARVTDPEARVMRQVGATEKHYRAQPRDGRACPFRSQRCPKTA